MIKLQQHKNNLRPTIVTLSNNIVMHGSVRIDTSHFEGGQAQNTPMVKETEGEAESGGVQEYTQRHATHPGVQGPQFG